jgi:NAD(P)-dependent dehydrogenase (short-subunit alcohol dehydrogenase family)
MGRISFDDLSSEKRYAATPAYCQSKLATLMFALELSRLSGKHGWGLTSNAAHPGLTKTNLQIAGPSHGSGKPTALTKFYQFSWRLLPFMWQDVDAGIIPILYAATDPQAYGCAFYGPQGFSEMMGGGVAPAKIPNAAKEVDDCRALWRLSERLTGVRYG